LFFTQPGAPPPPPGHGHDAGQFTFKAGDGLYDTFECRTTENLLALGSNGRIYSVPVSALPGARGDGVPITTLVELAPGTRILHYFAGPADTTLLLATTAGYGFTAKAGDMVSRVRGGKAFITLDEGDEPLAPRVVSDKVSAIACLSERGRMLVFGLDEIKSLSSGGRGVILMDLDQGEKLIAAQPISQRGVIVTGAGRGGKATEVALSAGSLAIHIGKRARKGRMLEAKIKPAALVLPK
jgi:topoisomerase-4 subunit A